MPALRVSLARLATHYCADSVTFAGLNLVHTVLNSTHVTCTFPALRSHTGGLITWFYSDLGCIPLPSCCPPGSHLSTLILCPLRSTSPASLTPTRHCATPGFTHATPHLGSTYKPTLGFCAILRSWVPLWISVPVTHILLLIWILRSIWFHIGLPGTFCPRFTCPFAHVRIAYHTYLYC